ncbi:MAG TPA: hypothetical protein VN711_02855 [Candidatus Saccharimonadales bacterium]|nr:hypothetical protein [Candidatus Saccharimonadales bacterium]
MTEQQRYNDGTMVLHAENNIFPSYTIDYRGNPRDRRVGSIKAILSGLRTIASVSHASASLLELGDSLPEPSREVPHDITQVQKMSGLMAAIWHFGKISNAPSRGEPETEKVDLERSMQYVVDLPEEHFVGKRQRRGLRMAKRFASQASQQPQHRNTCLGALEKHIFTLQSRLLAPYSVESLGISLPPFVEEPKRISLFTPEAIIVRRRLSPFIDHDMAGSLNDVGLRQHLRAKSLRKLAKLVGTPEDDLAGIFEIERLEQQLREDEQSVSLGWHGLFDSSIRLARLMEHPYRQAERDAAFWQEETERTVVDVGERYPGMEVYFKAGEAYGKVVWAEEWMQSLIENIGQNVGRIWLDAEAKKLPQTQGPHARPLLGVSALCEGEDFVLRCEDNGTGFGREYLEKGFQGQHGYISHTQSTGTAMQELAAMIAVYGGQVILKNIYLTPNGERIESSDPEFSEKFGIPPAGGIVEVRFGLH